MNTKHKGFSEIIAVAIFVAAIMFAQTAAFADEMVQGEVTSVNMSNNSFGLTRVNPVSGMSEKMTIVVPVDAKWNGINSMKDIHKGSHVQVDTHKVIRDIRGGWNIKAVSIAEMKSSRTR